MRYVCPIAVSSCVRLSVCEMSSEVQLRGGFRERDRIFRQLALTAQQNQMADRRPCVRYWQTWSELVSRLARDSHVEYDSVDTRYVDVVSMVP